MIKSKICKILIIKLLSYTVNVEVNYFSIYEIQAQPAVHTISWALPLFHFTLFLSPISSSFISFPKLTLISSFLNLRDYIKVITKLGL